MPLLTAKKQLAAAVEATAGSAPAGFPTAAQAATLPANLSVSPDVEKFAQDFVRDSATALKETVGKKAGGIEFECDLKGTTDGLHATGAPNYSKFLKGVGFEEVEIQNIAIGAVTSGPFRHGETITQTTTAATATVFMDTHNGAAEIYVDKDSVTGSPNNSAVWTGQDSGATATPTAVPADEGFGWRLVTTPLKEFDLNAVWGTNPTAGDVIEGQTSGARMIYQSGGVSVVKTVYRELRGTFSNGETLDNLSTGATGVGTLANPTREEYNVGHPMTQQVWEDGVAVQINGARGSLAMNFEVNRPTKLAFNYRGVFGSASDVPNLTGVNYDFTTAPLWAGAVSGYVDNENAADVDEADEQDPCLRTLTLDLGVQLADRECAGATGGLKEVIVGSRDGTFTMDPEATPEDDIGWLTALQNGQVQRLRVPVGSSDGNRFTIFSPGLQLDSAPSGDRDGLMTREVSGKLTGGHLNNLVASPTNLSSIGGDNELVIIYHTA